MDEKERLDLYEACLRYMKAGDYGKAYSCVVALYRLEPVTGYKAVQQFRVSMKKIISSGERALECSELLHGAYVLTAREKFDDFMIALEWYRKEEKRFWLPRREKLMPICKALQALADDELDELFLSQPPRTGKTGIIKFFLVWEICRHSEMTTLYSSYTKDVVDIFYNGLLEIFTDADTYDLPTIFPNGKVVSTRADIGLIDVERRKGYPSFMARAINAALNGLADASLYIVIDDIHNGITEAKNKQLLDNTYSVVSNNLLARNKDHTKFLWIGTRWSIYDCISRRIDLVENGEEFKNRRYRVVNVPAMNENDESNFDYPYNLGFSTEKFRQIRAQFEKGDDLASWLAQYMGTPIERDGAIFSLDSFRYYNGELPKNEKGEELEPDKKFAVVDPAWGGGDYVGAVMVYQYDDDLFVVDVVFNNGDKYVTQPEIAQKMMKYGITTCYIEATRVTNSYATELDDRLKKESYRANIQSNVKNWSGQQGKHQRICDKAPEIRERFVFLDKSKWNLEYMKFMNNVFAFVPEDTSKRSHDDAPDVLAMTIVNAFRPITRLKIVNANILDTF